MEIRLANLICSLREEFKSVEGGSRLVRFDFIDQFHCSLFTFRVIYMKMGVRFEGFLRVPTGVIFYKVAT